MIKNIFIATTMIGAIMIGCGDSSAGSDSSGGSTVNTAGGTGIGGSMARFAISGDKLYTLKGKYINAFDISIPDTPAPDITQPVNFDVETLYSYDKYLYVGAESGVYIYNKELDKVGDFTHTKSCDPVVVNRGIAFVTLSSGNQCRLNSGENSVQFLDVRDPLNPIYIGKKNMVHPTGLGVDDDILFVCDGKGGLKLFDVNVTENNDTNTSQVALTYRRESSKPNIDCYDVIAHKQLLIVSDGDDVKQFDYAHLPMAPLGDIK